MRVSGNVTRCHGVCTYKSMGILDIETNLSHFFESIDPLMNEVNSIRYK